MKDPERLIPLLLFALALALLAIAMTQVDGKPEPHGTHAILHA